MKRKIIVPIFILTILLILIWNIENLIYNYLTILNPYASDIKNLFYALQWLNIGYMINLFINNVIWQKLAANDVTNEPPRILVQLSSFFVMLIIISGILYHVYDYPVTTILAASGALGLVIGFALRNLILDTFSGLAINLEKPFEVGDWINCHTRMGNYIGQVQETNWRTTRLKTSSNNVVIIPNSYLTGTLLTNFSMPGSESRFDQIVVLDFSVNVHDALRIIETALTEAVLNGLMLSEPKKPKVKVYKITELGVEYKIKYFINPVHTSPSKATDGCLQYILNHLSQAGLSPSYPKQDVFNANMPWRQKTWEHMGDRISLLKKLSLFRLLNNDDLEILASNIKLKHLHPKDVVVEQGQSGDSMFIIIEGLFEVFILNGEEELKVATLSPGTFFGEKSLLTGEKRSATIKTVKESVVGELPKTAMEKLIESNENVVNILSTELAKRELKNKNVIDDSNNTDECPIETETNVFMAKIKNFFSL